MGLLLILHELVSCCIFTRGEQEESLYKCHLHSGLKVLVFKSFPSPETSQVGILWDVKTPRVTACIFLPTFQNAPFSKWNDGRGF